MVGQSRSYYLGPGVPRWEPASWDDVESAAASGLLDESRWVELKLEAPADNKNANLELARDLASLSAEGGILVVGVKDNEGKAGQVRGIQAVSALRERIDQVAKARVHPPLVVSSVEVFKPNDEMLSSGCLIVSVPMSPDAPHMVDKHYWGRGDKGKRKLDDLEVERYFADRRLNRVHTTAHLHSWIGSTSVRPNNTAEGRLYVSCSMRGAQEDQLLRFMYREDDTLPKFIQDAADGANMVPGGERPISLATKKYRGNQIEGWTTDDPSNPGDVSERDLILAEVHEGGVVNVLNGQMTHNNPAAGRLIYYDEILSIVIQSLLLCKSLAEHAAYHGQWNIGIHVTHCRGGRDSQLAIPGGVRGAYWLEENYEQCATVTSDELSSDSRAIAQRLLLPIARTLRVENRLGTQ